MQLSLLREKKWVSVKDTSMLVYKWVPVSEDEHTQPKKSGFARAQANVLAPTGGSIITMSSHPPELRTENSTTTESTNSSDRAPKVEASNEAGRPQFLSALTHHFVQVTTSN